MENTAAPDIFDTDKEVVSCILDVIIGHGVKHIVCSPGSRNAPILMASRAREELEKHIVIDERAAAFMALGIASVTQTPVALVCTSGTALLNYSPAIAEAYYQGIPLIVISADRPKEWIDQDDSQTLRQFDAMRNYVKGSYDISDRERNDSGIWYINRIVNDAMLSALRGKKGPVHLNVRLSPPLNGLKRREEANRLSARIIREIPNQGLPEKEKIKGLAKYLEGKKIVITVGFHLPDSKLNRALLKIRQHGNVVIMAETISNTHLPKEDYVIDSALSDIRRMGVGDQFQPDIVLSVGGALISRMLKEFLRNCAASGTEHWSVGPTDTTIDCFQGLSLRIPADPGRFISAISAELAHVKNLKYQKGESKSEKWDLTSPSNSYSLKFTELKTESTNRISRIGGDSDWTELGAYQEILNHIPRNSNLYLSNRTAIRYAQLIPHNLPHASFCNRGVSGIEGSTSTAVGGAIAYPGRSILLTGDMSFAHDLGGLAIAANSEAPLDIIVMNNKGGGIFRFIKSTSELPDREKYLCANPNCDIKSLALTFGFDYYFADSIAELKKCLKLFNSDSASSRRKILEVDVPTEKSAAILKKLLY